MIGSSLVKIGVAAVCLFFVAASPDVVSAAQKKNPNECFTDDGYGRTRPCSAPYARKQQKKNPYDCFTDDGYGRKRPCSAPVKRR